MKGQSNRHYPSNPGDFPSAVLGHELGNVLNGLLGMAELLGDTGLDTAQSQWLDAIVHSGRQMQALIQSQWRALHPYAREPEPRRDTVDGVRLLEQVFTSHVPAARFRNNRLFLDMEPEVPRFWRCDPCMVRQLLDNVLGNAIKFTKGGDIVVNVLARPPLGTLLIRVSDTGPGFGPACPGPAGVAERAGPLNQGLGLRICHEIVHALKGGLEITSPRGQGAQIEMTLPETFDDPRDSPRLDCSLFRLVLCRLRLAMPLLAPVRNMLDRVGVEWTERDTDGSGERLVLELSDHHRGSGRGGRGLWLRPVAAHGAGIGSRAIALPVLETSLASQLLELALAWRTQRIRSGSADSTPAPHQAAQTGVLDPHRE